jgi:acetoin utilization deacetylase AcuC-like enzyme
VTGSPRVGLYDDPVFREHDSGKGHPERPERLDAVRRGIREAGLEERVQVLAPRRATREELLRVHAADHVARVESTSGSTLRFDPDTQAGPRSCEAALLAAGGVADAVDRVLGGGLDRAFCLARPPGHHAESSRAMGFCLFNNVAVGAARALAKGLERVLVIDFDVHHGNGTQEIFYRDPRVLYISTHAFPFYPGTGGIDEVGAGAGRGFTVNLPLRHGCGDVEYAHVYRDIVGPIGRAFDPQLVLVSAGFDPHAADPLAGMTVTEAGFAEVARVCLTTAAGSAAGRSVFVLEGGYDLAALAASSAAVLRVMLDGGAPPAIEAAPPGLEALLGLYRTAFAPFWPVLRG